jgi:cytochrome subunit of sulfide dehydrogenase
MRTTTTAMRIVAWVALALPIAAFAADLDSLKAQCNACHGPSGNSPYSDVPTIAGQSSKFIAKQLRSFQMWDRPCTKTEYRSGDRAGTSVDKCEVAGALTNEDIGAVADYYSKQPFKPASQPFDPARAAGGAALHDQYCETCHAEGGSATARGPRLAGQWKPYLRATLKFVPTGEHLVPPMMERRIVDFSAEEINQLLDYYASQQD